MPNIVCLDEDLKSSCKTSASVVQKAPRGQAKEMVGAMLSVDAFRDVQHESTEKISQHLIQLQRTMCEAIELHREQLYVLQRVVQPGRLGSQEPTPSKLDTERNIQGNVDSIGENIKRQQEPINTMNPNPKGSGITAESGETMPPLEVLLETSKTDFKRKEDFPLRVKPGKVLTWGVGYSGKWKLLDYNFDNLRSFAFIPAIFSKASIFRLRLSMPIQLLLQPFLIAFTYGVVVLQTGNTKLNTDFEKSTWGKGLHFCVNALQRLVPFLLGLFISLNLQRWWTIRSQYLHTVHVRASTLSMLLGITIPDNALKFRKRIEGYLLAAHNMIHTCAHHHRRDLAYEKLMKRGMLSEAEVKHLRESLRDCPPILKENIGACDMSVALVPIVWSAQLIYRLFQYSKKSPSMDIPVPIMTQMLIQCNDIKKATQDIEMMLNSPLPFPYTHLIVLVVQALAVMTCIECGVYLAVKGDDSTWLFVTHAGGVLVLNGLYSSLLSLAAVLANPFSDDCVNFAQTNLQCRLRKQQIFSHDVQFASAAIDKEIVDEFENSIGQGRKERVEEEPDDEDLDDDGGGDDAD